MLRTKTKGSFGERLRELRTSAGLNSMDLADRSGMRLRNVMALEGGKVPPTFEDACKLADALGVSLDDFRHLPLYLVSTAPGLNLLRPWALAIA